MSGPLNDGARPFENLHMCFVLLSRVHRLVRLESGRFGAQFPLEPWDFFGSSHTSDIKKKNWHSSGYHDMHLELWVSVGTGWSGVSIL